jgi:outer membrane protein assembly factor BamB
MNRIMILWIGVVALLAVGSASAQFDCSVLSDCVVEEWVLGPYATGSIPGLAVDELGNVYSGSYDYTVRKILPNGSVEWEYVADGLVLSVSYDDGWVYAGTTSGEVLKLDVDGGSLNWSYSGISGDIDVYARDGFVYAAGSDVFKIDADSAGLVWTFSGHTGNVRHLAVDSQGNVYSGGSDETVRKISPAGVELWVNSDPTNFILAVAVDNDDVPYSTGSDSQLRRYDPDTGVQSDNFNIVNTGRRIAFDYQNNVFVAYDSGLRKLDSDFNVIFTVPLRVGVSSVLAVVQFEDSVYIADTTFSESSIVKYNDLTYVPPAPTFSPRGSFGSLTGAVTVVDRDLKEPVVEEPVVEEPLVGVLDRFLFHARGFWSWITTFGGIRS